MKIQVARAILKEETHNWGREASSVKIYYKARVVKAEWWDG